MMLDVWPDVLSAAQELDWNLKSTAATAGMAVDDSEPVADLSGGGKWMLSMSGVYLRKAVTIKAARALRILARCGSAPMIVNTCECQFAPRTSDMTGSGLVPHSDDTPFSDETLYQSGFISAVVVGAVANGATEMTVKILAGAPFAGGEAFSAYHAPPRGYDVVGKRRYEIGSVGTPVTVTGGFTQTVTFGPKARAAIADGAVLDFDNVGCTMRMTNYNDFFGAIRMGRFGNISPQWIEAY